MPTFPTLVSCLHFSLSAPPVPAADLPAGTAPESQAIFEAKTLEVLEQLSR